MIKKLNAGVLALALLAAVPAPVSAQYTQSQISSQINSGLPSNGQNGITAANLRSVLNAMDAAIFQIYGPNATPGAGDTVFGIQNGANVQFPVGSAVGSSTAGDLAVINGSGQLVDSASLASSPGYVTLPVRLLEMGTNLYPSVVPQFSTTATTTSGSNTITVTSASGGALVVGASVWMSGTFATGTIVTNISGLTVTVSNNALATNSTPAAITFGQTRYDTTSEIIANTIGAEWGRFGSASQGATDWAARYFPGSQLQNVPAIIALSQNGAIAGYFGTESADQVTANSSNVIAANIVALNNNATVQNTVWGISVISQVTAGANVNETFGEEVAIANFGSVGAIDPFNTNNTANTTVLRLDAGDGASGLSDASSAIQIIGNGSKFASGGIIIDGAALDTGTDAHLCGLCLPQNISIGWFTSSATNPAYKTWKIYDVTGSNTQNSLVLNGNSAVFSTEVATAAGTVSLPGVQVGLISNGGYGLYQSGSSLLFAAASTQVAFMNTTAMTVTEQLIAKTSLMVGAGTALTLNTAEVGLQKDIASASAPGAAGGKLALVCGTTGGTAKFIAYAGTSSTPSTILDNIGAGVTGC